MDTSKVQAVLSWPQPKTVRARSFLGLAGYYRRFIQNYGLIAAPLTKLLKKEGFCWTEEAVAAFHTLQQPLSSAPNLHLPDFTTPNNQSRRCKPRDGTHGCGCWFGKNPPAGKPAGLGKTRLQVDSRVHFCTRTRRVSGGFRVSADLTIAIIRITIQHSNKMKLTINP